MGKDLQLRPGRERDDDQQLRLMLALQGVDGTAGEIASTVRFNEGSCALRTLSDRVAI